MHGFDSKRQEQWSPPAQRRALVDDLVVGAQRLVGGALRAVHGLARRQYVQGFDQDELVQLPDHHHGKIETHIRHQDRFATPAPNTRPSDPDIDPRRPVVNMNDDNDDWFQFAMRDMEKGWDEGIWSDENVN